MLTNINVDRTDAAYNTKAPFTWDSPLSIGGAELHVNSILSIKIQVTEALQPTVRLYRLQKILNGNGAILEWRDHLGTVAGYLSIRNNAISNISDVPAAMSKYASRCIIDAGNVIRGHVVYTDEFVSYIFSLFTITGLDEIYTEAGDFMLLPQCMQCSLQGVAKSVLYSTETSSNMAVNADICFVQGQGVRLNYDKYTESANAAKVKISVAGVYSSPEDSTSGILNLVIDNAAVSASDAVTSGTAPSNTTATPFNGSINVDGKHLMIAPSLLSNIRVLTNSSGVVLKGVADV